MMKRGLILLFLFLVTINIVIAHEEEFRIDNYIIDTSVNYITIAAIVIVVLTILSLTIKNKSESLKFTLFILISLAAILSTLYLAGSTIYLNMISETKGPVHWHADFEIWKCDEKIDLLDPKGLTNRIGSPVFHEHNDFRIHVEGVVVEKDDVSLHKFFEIVGGSLTKDSFSLPTNNNMVTVNNDETCNGEDAEIQAFVYKILNPEEERGNWLYEQEKIDDFENYVLSGYSQVPPGDCIIIEFDKVKESTDKMCETYKVALQEGDVIGS